MATTVADNPFDTQQPKFTGFGDVSGQITGGARNGQNWDFMDQQGKVLTSVAYDDFVNNYQSDGSGAVRSGITSVNGVPVYNFNSNASAPAIADSGTAPTAAAPTPAPTATPAPTGGLISGSMQPPTAPPQAAAQMAPPTPMASMYSPAQREVDRATDTAAGQVESMLSKDSPLLQRARTLATQGMAQRGLVNSSMNQGAGVAAMIDRVTPLAQQDANTYNAARSENMQAQNQAAMFNVGEQNKFGLQGGAQRFEASEAALNRQQQTALQVGQQEFAASQQAIQNDFNLMVQKLQESGMDFRQARDIASNEAMKKLDQMGIQNRFDQELALKDKQFNIEQYNLEKRQLAQNQAELDKLGLQIKANLQSIPTSFAAQVTNTTMAGVNAIIADGNLNAEAKKTSINNLVTYANAQIAWAEKFYNTTIPRITTP